MSTGDNGRVDAALTELGVKAKDLPGFLLVLILVAVGLEVMVVSSPMAGLQAKLLPGLAYLGLLAAAYPITLVFYAVGEVWDKLFDDLYSVECDQGHITRPGR